MSMYNVVSKHEERDVIYVSCNPDQYSHDSVGIDKEDFEKILQFAKELGWTDGD